MDKKIVTIMVALLLAVFIITGINALGKSERFRPTPKFQVGQTMETKLDGKTVMILSSHCYTGEPACQYRVRWANTNGYTTTMEEMELK